MCGSDRVGEAQDRGNLAERVCGRSYADAGRALDRDRFMTAEEALDWGLIDRILSEPTATPQSHETYTDWG